jgi:ABC-type dipeptide/oligopeptide/nickel transport system permease component
VASPLSGIVLGASAALTSPTLYDAFVEGSVPLPDALSRFVITIIVTTIAVTLVQWLFLGTSPMTEAQQEAARRLAELGARGHAAADVVPTPRPETADD